jgi:CheY-like chemotaxis protein
MDIRMPELDGLQATRRILAHADRSQRRASSSRAGAGSNVGIIFLPTGRGRTARNASAYDLRSTVPVELWALIDSSATAANRVLGEAVDRLSG